MNTTLRETWQKSALITHRSEADHLPIKCRSSADQNRLLLSARNGRRRSLRHGVCVLIMFDSYGCKSRHSLMEAKCSKAQGRRREAWSERSAEQMYEPMNKNRIRGNRCRTSWQTTTKSISIKGAGCKFGGCVRKAVELTSGDLLFVSESRLRVEQSTLTGQQKSAEGILGAQALKARTAPQRGLKRVGSRQRNL
jgi:hypothetical protein